MSKIDLETLSSGYMDVQLLNRNFTRIEEWSDTVMSRLGEAPNQLEADLDLNGNQILNVGLTPSDPSSLVSYAAMTAYVEDRASGIVLLRRHSFTATPGQTEETLPTFTYVPGTSNLAVYADGVRLFAPTDITESGPTTVTFNTPLVGGEQVEILSTEFLGTTTLPPHQHGWGDIVGPPDTATRWPTWGEVENKPTTFPPGAHNHPASSITSGRLADARRGVYVQSGAPASPQTGDLWIW